jgi:WD40 repeat protein
VFSGKGGTEALQHSHDVLALAVRPDGKQLASATLNGEIALWDPIDAVLQVEFELRFHLVYYPVERPGLDSTCMWQLSFTASQCTRGQA